LKWAFKLLGLPMDADTSSIKRAYAQLLRSTRPDEDPEGFQRLHAAYKTALAHAEKKPASQPHVIVTTSAPIETPRVVDMPTMPAPRADIDTPATSQTPLPSAPAQAKIIPVDINAAADAVITQAIKAEETGELMQWLQARPEFWSIQVKQQTGQRVLAKLLKQPQAMAAESLDTLLQFFDLDRVGSGVNPLALQQLRLHQAMQWELQPRHHAALARRTDTLNDGKPDVERVRHYVDMLKRPLHWPDVVKTAMRRGRTSDLGNFIRAFCGGRLDGLPPAIQREHAQFWHRATTKGAPNWPRFVVGSIQAIAVAIVFALVVIAFSVLAWVGSHGQTVFPILPGAITFLGVLALWLCYAGWSWLDYWQRMPESNITPRTWLQRLAIPLLCALALALDYVIGAPWIAGPIMLITFILAIRRMIARSTWTIKGKPVKFPATLLWFVFWIASKAFYGNSTNGDLLPNDLPYTAVAALATMCVWLIDTWRNRAFLFRKLARA
jgi:hypothetical protein